MRIVGAWIDKSLESSIGDRLNRMLNPGQGQSQPALAWVGILETKTVHAAGQNGQQQTLHWQPATFSTEVERLAAAWQGGTGSLAAIDAREVYQRRTQRPANQPPTGGRAHTATALPDPDSVYAARRSQATGSDGASGSGSKPEDATASGGQD